MSATAPLANPAAAAPAGQTSAKPGAAAGAHATGALGAFDAIMAAFFASMNGTSQLGDAASAGATAAAQPSPTDGGKLALGDKDAPAASDGEAAQADAVTPDAGLMLALLGLGAAQPALTPTLTAAADSGGSPSGAPAGQASPTPTATQAGVDPAALLAAQAAATSQTPAAEVPTAPATPGAQDGAEHAAKPEDKGGTPPQAGERRAAPTPPGLAHMAPSALEHARVAQAAETQAPPPSSEPAPTVQAAAEVVQQAANTPPPAAAKPADKPAEKNEKAPRAARTEATAPAAVSGGRVGGAASVSAMAAASASGPAAADKPAVEGAPAESAQHAQAELDAPPQDAAPAGQASAQSALPTREAQAHAPAATQVRGSPETVANLSAHLIKKLDERASRFDLQLDPIGLGRVDVRLEINARGQVTAAMSFDNPQAAAELKARSAELQQALEQAGFDIAGGMSFDVADQSNGGAQQQRNFGSDTGPDSGAAFRGRAFQAALDTAGEAANAATAFYYRRAPAAGVDVRI